MVQKDRYYDMAFSTGGLFINECITIATLYLEAQNWNIVSASALEKNLLAFRKASSSVRTLREIVKRLKMLSLQELRILTDGDRHEHLGIAWLAVCRTYRVIGEFTAEVVFERHLSGRMIISYDDFDIYLDRKAEWHPELEKLSVTTRSKLRQVLFRMMREANIIAADGHICTANLSPRLQNLIALDNRNEIRFFPGALIYVDRS